MPGGQVIQGFFPGGKMRPLVRRAATDSVTAQRLQSRGRSSTVQRSGGDGCFAVDPVQLGLARCGGSPLPEALLRKMEGAFGADFSAVRVHLGPQAARIGAVAFTTGADIYFTPGRYQPESMQGQQLIGHELAHVVQQRQGRVPAPNSGVAVVHNHALEAEADRLGTRAALQCHMVRSPWKTAANGGNVPATLQAKRGAHNPWRFLEGRSGRGAWTTVSGRTVAHAVLIFTNGTRYLSPERESGWQGGLPNWLRNIYTGPQGRPRSHDAEAAVLLDLEDYIAANPGLVPQAVHFDTSHRMCRFCRQAVTTFCNFYGIPNGPHNEAN